MYTTVSMNTEPYTDQKFPTRLKLDIGIETNKYIETDAQLNKLPEP